MKGLKGIIYGIWIALVEAVGFLASLLTRKGTRQFYETAAQPPLSPPKWVFPTVWAALYALMGIGAARVWQAPESRERSQALNWFVIQLALNFFWTLIFFNAKAYGAAAVWLVVLWAAVLVMILKFRKVDSLAAWLQVPYLAWLTFAAYLNFGVWLVN